MRSLPQRLGEADSLVPHVVNVAELANERVAQDPLRAESLTGHAEQGQHALSLCVACRHDEVLRVDGVFSAADRQLQNRLLVAADDVDVVVLIVLQRQWLLALLRRIPQLDLTSASFTLAMCSAKARGAAMNEVPVSEITSQPLFDVDFPDEYSDI